MTLIAQRLITDALLDYLTGTLSTPVGDHTAPTPPPKQYHVLSGAPGSTLIVTLGSHSAARTIRYRINTVAIADNIATSREAAESNADAATDAILSRATTISGDGWQIGARYLIGDSGPITDSGPAVNIVRDYEIHVARGPAATPDP